MSSLPPLLLDPLLGTGRGTEHRDRDRDRGRAPVARVVLVMSGEVRIPDLDAPLGPGRLAILPAAWSGELSALQDTSWLDIDLVPPGGTGRREVVP